ncbi:MAG: S41 family peptidase [Chloroflexi bacterium]|nr:S41 family peptidase [Chloroflexota bacterium]
MKRALPIIAALVAFLIATATAGCVLPNVLTQRTPTFTPEPAPTPAPLPTQVPEALREIWEVWQVLQDDYVDPKALDDATALGRGAISGMLKALRDPYTAFIEPDHYEVQLDDLEGRFEGIGAVIGLRDGRVVIVSPIQDSPAERAGLRAGDAILSIDGAPTDGMNVAQVVSRVRGKSGSTVVLRIAGGAAAPRDIVLVRALIVVPTVTVQKLPGGLVHIRLASFVRQTDEDLQGALRSLDASSRTGVILDLRNNPGGLLDTAVAVASQFLADGLVLYEVDRAGAEKTHEVRPGGLAPRIPLVVLVNGGSASASEVVAGALQARGRAPLVGEKTFGKGSINLLRRLSTGAGVYVTTARWLTPDHRPIEGVGLQPDIAVTDDPATEADEQLERAVEELQKKVTSTSP